jgi:hypothetical protein
MMFSICLADVGKYGADLNACQSNSRRVPTSSGGHLTERLSTFQRVAP